MKERLDILLLKRGLAPSREQAKAMIMSGDVFVNDVREDKAGTFFDDEARIEVRGKKLKYVSRGGLKLEKALDVFGIDLCGLTCMDAGASTGGFTDCMLQNGARKVYSVDVGRGQLAWKLATDERVVRMDKTNVRYITPDDFSESIDFATIDVSFISLKKVIVPVKSVLTAGGRIVALIKPQFEAGREKVGKKGVVRDEGTHVEVIRGVSDFCVALGLKILGMTFSPVKGPEGNIEYLIYLKKEDGPESGEGSLKTRTDESGEGPIGDVKELVRAAHQELD